MVEFLMRARLPSNEGAMEAEIVLRDFGESRPHRYVTHQHNIQYGEHEGFYWGHYFSDLKEAQQDFIERCNRKGIG